MEPKVRFKGFEGEWKKASVKELCRINTGKSNTQDQETDGRYPFFIRSENIMKSNKYLYDCEAVITIGDGQIGKVFHYINGKFDLHQRCYMMSSFTDINGKYFYYYFSANFYERAIKMSAKATVDSVRLDMIADMQVLMPISVKEQQSIATYFRTLDSKIQSISKKLASLKKLKSASLVSMFPQQGKTTPKVRFKGFEGEWSTSNLGSIFAERIESNENGEMLSVTMNNGIIRSSDNGRFDNSNSDKSKYKVVKIGDIAYNSMRMWQGASGVSQYEGIVSPAYTVVTPRIDVDTDFFGYLFKTDDVIRLFKLNSQGLTSDNWNLKYPAFSRICVSYPKSKEEQQSIAAFFRTLDRKIALETARLEKLKQIKLACLDKMFV